MDGEGEEERGVVVFEVRLERIDARDDNDDAGLGDDDELPQLPRKNSSSGGKFCLLELNGLVLFLLLIITLEDEEEDVAPPPRDDDG